MRRTWRYVPLLVTLLAGSAAAQTELQRFERQLEQIRRDTRLLSNENIPVEQRTYFDYGAFTTANYLSLDDSDLENHVLWQYDLVAYGRLNLDNVHEFFVRGRGQYRDFHKGDAFDDDDDDESWDGRLERLYYRFDLARYLAASKGLQTEGNLTVKVGRDLVFWANGLTLSLEIDGAVVDLEYGPASVEFVAGRTPTDTVDIDSSRPNFDGHTNRFFYGALASVRAGTHRPFVYALVQRDHNSDDTSVAEVGGTDVTTVFDYDSTYFGIGSTGALTDRLAYGLEFVYQSGRSLSNSFQIEDSGAVTSIPQTTEDIRAWAFDAQIDYLLADERRTRFSGELILSSGDSDRLSTSSTFGGNLTGTDDEAFNAFGLVNTGLAFAPAVSNLVVLRGGVSMFPFPDVRALRRMQIGTDLFVFAKLDKDAPIDELTTDDRYLGFEPDLYLNWQITSDLTLALRYGAFIPGQAIDADDRIRQFIYAGLTFAF